MEWKKLCDGDPETGKYYIVVNKHMEIAIRYYDVLFRVGTKSKRVICKSYVEDWPWGWETYECDMQKPFKGFTQGTRGGTLYKDPYYYMELPPLPEKSEIDMYRCQIFELQKKIKLLEEEKGEQQ